MSDIGLALHGEIDIAANDAVESKLRDAATAALSAGQDLVVDVSGVTFIDSTGLRAFIGASTLMRDGGHELRLRHAPRAVRRVVELTGLGELLDET